MNPDGMNTDQLVHRNVTNMLRGARHSQADLAATMRLSQPMVSRKLAGRSDWTLRDLDLIAKHFGITVPVLVSKDCELPEHMRAYRHRSAA
jgi:transcriptional regulator with XRE-family HTH domain